MGKIAFFLRHVLRDTWLPMTGLVCAMGVDGMRPRGSCGTHFRELAITLFFGAFLFCGLGLVSAFRRAPARRVGEALAAAATNLYSAGVAAYLSLPYLPWIESY